MTFDNTDHFLLSREWRAVRMRVLERDGAKCACCGATAAGGARMNVDHIKPRIRYPELALTESNLQVLCEACNHGKGARYETDWRSHSAAEDVPSECRRMRARPEGCCYATSDLWRWRDGEEGPQPYVSGSCRCAIELRLFNDQQRREEIARLVAGMGDR